MLPASQELLAVLTSPAFQQGKAQECAALARAWSERHSLDRAELMVTLTHFGAKLMSGVRNAKMLPTQAAELLTRLFVLSDLDVPPSLYALHETLALLTEQQQRGALRDGTSGSQYMQQQMGRILPSVANGNHHAADQCRYTGRFGLHAK